MFQCSIRLKVDDKLNESSATRDLRSCPRTVGVDCIALIGDLYIVKICANGCRLIDDLYIAETCKVVLARLALIALH